MRLQTTLAPSAMVAGILLGYVTTFGDPARGTEPVAQQPVATDALQTPGIPDNPASKSDPLVPAWKQAAEHLEPSVPRPEQEKAAWAKLAELAKKTGRKPNIPYLLVDDMGYGDPGCYGVGTAVGGPTPHIDALARGGLKLTFAYAQPTCTPYPGGPHHRPPAGPDRADPTGLRQREVHQESVGRRGVHRQAAFRRRVPDGLGGQVAPRGGRGDAPARGQV